MFVFSEELSNSESSTIVQLPGMPTGCGVVEVGVVLVGVVEVGVVEVEVVLVGVVEVEVGVVVAVVGAGMTGFGGVDRVGLFLAGPALAAVAIVFLAGDFFPVCLLCLRALIA